MNNAQALHEFWNSFDITAYDESSVPDGATFPYITYQVIDGSFGDSFSSNASIWYKSTSWTSITNKSETIKNVLGLGGIMIATDDGGIWIKRGSPFAQRMSDNDDTIRRMLLSIQIDYI